MPAASPSDDWPAPDWPAPEMPYDCGWLPAIGLAAAMAARPAKMTAVNCMLMMWYGFDVM